MLMKDPNWFDNLIGETSAPEQIIEKLTNSEDFRTVVDKAVEKANHRHDGPGPSFSQIVRSQIAEGLERDEP